MLWFKRYYFKIPRHDNEQVSARIQAPDQDFTSFLTAVTWNSVGGAAPSVNYSYGKDHGPNTGLISVPYCGAIYKYKCRFIGLCFSRLNAYKYWSTNTWNVSETANPNKVICLFWIPSFRDIWYFEITKPCMAQTPAGFYESRLGSPVKSAWTTLCHMHTYTHTHTCTHQWAGRWSKNCAYICHKAKLGAQAHWHKELEFKISLINKAEPRENTQLTSVRTREETTFRK